MRPHLKAAQLRRQIAYLNAVLGADGELAPQSKRLQTWRSEISAQGYAADEVSVMFGIEARWFKGLGRAPVELLHELAAELPKAQQLEEEHRIEVARRAKREPSWNVQTALAWIRFRDVAQACRFLERRDALLSLWRDGLETDELEQRLANGELRCTGVEADIRQEISPADWAGEGRKGLRLMRATEPYAARKHGEPIYTELRFARQALQHAFPRREDMATTDGPSLAAARVFLRHCEGEVKWDVVWDEVFKATGKRVSNTRRENLQKPLREEFPDKILRGAPKKKLPGSKRSPPT